MKMFVKNATAILVLLSLAACEQSGEFSPIASDSTSRELPASSDEGEFPERPQYPFGLGCGWEIASNIDTMNIFYPDESAKYWVALVPVIPNTRLRIDGRFPDTRYFSYNVYDPLLRPTDAIADFELAPNNGGVNPFALEGAAAGDSYTAYLEFTPQPEERTPNTIYAGEFSVSGVDLPQPLLTGLIYRTYVPAEGLDFDGGVGLPILTLETDDGEVEILPFADCVGPLLPTLGNTLPETGLNDVLLGVDIMDEPLLLASGLVPLGDADARTHVFRGIPEFYLTFLAELLGLPALADAVETTVPSTGGGGFLSNIHNSYTYNIYYRHKGNVIAYRAKAPSFRGQEGVEFGTEQLRYWSVCQNDVPTQRYSGCFRDEQAHLDDDGYFTAIISDAADRPSNAHEDNAVNWLPWGPYIDAGVVYRHMLPNPSFSETISNIPRGTSPDEILGEYAPQTAYCSREVVEAAGDSAEAIFRACQDWTTEQYGVEYGGVAR